MMRGKPNDMKNKIELMYQQFGKDEKHKCRDCSNLVYHRYNRAFYKCKIYGETHSEASDWRLKYVACGMFNKEYTGNPVINIIKHSGKGQTEEPQIDGQVTLF